MYEIGEIQDTDWPNTLNGVAQYSYFPSVILAAGHVGTEHHQLRSSGPPSLASGPPTQPLAGSKGQSGEWSLGNIQASPGGEGWGPEWLWDLVISLIKWL